MEATYTHEVIDARTGQVVTRCRSLSAALRSADRRDAAYGAVRYTVRAVRS